MLLRQRLVLDGIRSVGRWLVGGGGAAEGCYVPSLQLFGGAGNRATSQPPRRTLLSILSGPRSRLLDGRVHPPPVCGAGLGPREHGGGDARLVPEVGGGFWGFGACDRADYGSTSRVE
jgi:hypothetical protein